MEINNLLNSDPIEPALLEAWKASPLSGASLRNSNSGFLSAESLSAATSL
jgi:hypothetical protein